MTAAFYELFDLPPSFSVDADELERRYLERSKAVHPDRFVNEAAGKRVAALQQAMELNEAYKTLRKPVPRAEYLLASHGVTIGANEQLDPGFLTTILQAREELSEAKHRGDDGKLAELETAMSRRRRAVIESLGGLWEEFEQTRDLSLLDTIKRELILLRYLDRYLEQFDDEEDD